MARIPDQELERLKRDVSLARLIAGQGHARDAGQGSRVPLPVPRGRRHAELHRESEDEPLALFG